jgi:hypothetical protein
MFPLPEFQESSDSARVAETTVDPAGIVRLPNFRRYLTVYEPVPVVV